MKENPIKRIVQYIFADKFIAATMEMNGGELCHENQYLLSAYVDAELDSLDAATLYPELHEQKKNCSACQSAYEELKHILTLEQAGLLLEPPIAVRTDLSFLGIEGLGEQSDQPLRQPAAEAEQTMIERVENAIRWRLSAMGQMTASLSAEFIDSLQPALQPEYLKTSVRDLFAVQSPQIADDLNVTVVVRNMKRKPDLYIVAVAADIPSRDGWPNLGDTEVTLLVGDQVRQTQHTNAFGKVEFLEVDKEDLPRLSISVRPE